MQHACQPRGSPGGGLHEAERLPLPPPSCELDTSEGRRILAPEPATPSWRAPLSDQLQLEAEGGSVRALLAGERVSGLGINMRRLQIARGVLVECGGIGGVGTPPAHRGKGYSTKVMAEAMAHQKRLGKRLSGLYTGTRIVAHRLYRRFGFADVTRLRDRVKYLDFTAWVRGLAEGRLAEAVERDEAAASLELTAELDVTGAGTVTLRYGGGGGGGSGSVEVTSGADGSAPLAVRSAVDVFNALAGSTLGAEEALRLGLVEMGRGERDGFCRLASVLFEGWVSPKEAG